jgi:hypothetical protein
MSSRSCGFDASEIAEADKEPLIGVAPSSAMSGATLNFQSSHVDRVDGTLIRETSKWERMAADFLTDNKFDHLGRPDFASKIHTIFERNCADDYYQQTFRDAF